LEVDINRDPTRISCNDGIYPIFIDLRSQEIRLRLFDDHAGYRLILANDQGETMKKPS